MRPEDTSKRDPLLHVLGMMAEGQSDYITGMEADGQRQLVQSPAMPIQSPWPELRALGFKPDDIPTDELFVACELPPGWTKQGTDHAMWSKILDERGVERVAVFYKAAFYDRSAHATITSPARDIVSGLVYGAEDAELPTSPPWPWEVLTEQEKSEVPKIIAAHEDRALSLLRLPHVANDPKTRKTYDDRLANLARIRELLGVEPRLADEEEGKHRTG